MNIKISITSSIIIYLLSCSSPNVDCHGQFIYSQVSFSKDEQYWINNSAARWNIWTGHQVMNVSQGDSDTCIIHKGNIESPHIGSEYSKTMTITIDTDQMKTLHIYDEPHFESFMMHEMGHSLGYNHLGIVNGDALMSPMSALDFTDIDRIECIKKGMCLSLKP